AVDGQGPVFLDAINLLVGGGSYRGVDFAIDHVELAELARPRLDTGLVAPRRRALGRHALAELQEAERRRRSAEDAHESRRAGALRGPCRLRGGWERNDAVRQHDGDKTHQSHDATPQL